MPELAGAAVNVALDVTALLAGTTGVARYVRELSAALEQQGVHFVRFGIGRGDDRLISEARRLRVPLRAVHSAWRLLGIPRAEWLAPGCELVHVPDLVPAPTRLPLALTVHDVDAIELPDLHPPRAIALQRAQVAAAQTRAAVVLVPSQATADALARHGVAPERVVVTRHGVTRLPAPDDSLVPDRPFFLVVGSVNARKGQGELVRAFGRASVGDSLLVLAGPDGYGAEVVHAAIAASEAADRIRCLGPVSDAQLAGLYGASRAVCVPSLGEGFGMPVLEAAAAGATVLASDLPVLREIGDAVAQFAPPGDEAAWIAALEGAAGAAAGGGARDYARSFTWDAPAALTKAAYDRIATARV